MSITAVFVNRSGREFSLPVIHDRSRNKFLVQRENGVWVEFADEIDSPHGPLAWVETLGNPEIRPCSTRKLRNLAEVRL